MAAECRSIIILYLEIMKLRYSYTLCVVVGSHMCHNRHLKFFDKLLSINFHNGTISPGAVTLLEHSGQLQRENKQYTVWEQLIFKTLLSITSKIYQKVRQNLYQQKSWCMMIRVKT